MSAMDPVARLCLCLRLRLCSWMTVKMRSILMHARPRGLFLRRASLSVSVTLRLGYEKMRFNGHCKQLASSQSYHSVFPLKRLIRRGPTPNYRRRTPSRPTVAIPVHLPTLQSTLVTKEGASAALKGGQQPCALWRNSYLCQSPCTRDCCRSDMQQPHADLFNPPAAPREHSVAMNSYMAPSYFPYSYPSHRVPYAYDTRDQLQIDARRNTLGGST